MVQKFEAVLKTGLPDFRLEFWKIKHAGKIERLIRENEQYLAAAHEPVPRVYPDRAAVVKAIRHPGNSVRYGMWFKDALTGSIELLLRTDEPGVAEIGYWVGEAYRDRTFATNAARTLTQYAFMMTELRQINAKVHNHNPASQHVIRAAGYVYDARLSQERRHKFFDYGWHVRRRSSGE